MNKIFITIICLVVFGIMFFSCNFVLASFDAGNLSANIGKTYSLNDKLTGWINISFEDEDLDSQISSSFGGSIELLEFLEINSINSDNYNCTPKGCDKAYSYTNPSYSQASFTLDEEKLLGLVILGGTNVQITDLKFEISSDETASCENQLSIDLLDNGEINWENTKATSETCGSKKYGCYGSSTKTVSLLKSAPYCQKINLPEAPKIKVGVYLQGTDSEYDAELLEMQIFDLNGFQGGECYLPEPAGSGGEVECDIDYGIKENGDFYICIDADEDTDYELKAESGTSDPCGFNYRPSSSEPTYSMNYQIYAQAYKYANVGSFVVNSTIFEQQNNDLQIGSNYLDPYISNTDNYDRDCSDYCIIPIKLLGDSQSIVLDEIELTYTESGSSGSSIDTIYNVQESEATISSNGFLKLDIGKANFSVPSSYGDFNLILSFEGNSLIEQNISVEETALINSVYPRSVPAAYPTTFVASVTEHNNESIVKYTWDFGDNSTQETTDSRVVHTYEDIDNYDLELTIEDSDGNQISKTFDINVISPKNAANTTLQDLKTRINNIGDDIDSFSSWYNLDELVNQDDLLNNITALETDYLQASEDDDYVDIMEELIGLRVPYQIKPSTTAALQFFNDKDKISLIKVQEIAGGSYSNSRSDAYKEGIVSWFAQNINFPIDYNLISFYYDDGVEDVLSVFEINIEPKNDLGTAYLIIEKSEDEILFDRAYNIETSDDSSTIGIVIDLDSDQSVGFALIEDIGVFELDMYLSPSLTEIDVSSGGGDDNEPTWIPWTIFFGILIGGLFIYILLQEWYKKNYEKHLFKNKNELYNLLTFISNAKKHKLHESEMKKHLHKAGWKFEQVTYAMRKFKGKRTGMFEIPILRFFEKKKIEQEIAKRQAPSRRFANR